MAEEFSSINILDALERFTDEKFRNFFDSFQCEKNKPIERFLKDFALQNAKQRFSITYLVLNQVSELTGFFTLATKPVKFDRAKLSGKYLRRVRQFCRPQENEIDWDGQYLASGYLIAQLAKNSSPLIGAKPSGAELLKHAFGILQDVQKQVGGGIIFLECEDKEKLLSFYIRQSFFEFGRRSSDTPLDADEPILYHQMLSVF